MTDILLYTIYFARRGWLWLCRGGTRRSTAPPQLTL